MAKKVFKSDLSVSGIQNLQKQLRDYQKSLDDKCEQLIRELLKKGITVAEYNINESPLGKYVSVKTDISSEKMGCNGMLIATGKTMESDGYAPFNTLLAIEFGAGIHYNPIPNPNANELGLGVGTFPGQIHAFEDYWFYWDEEKQKWLPTHGVRATMPMYNASISMMSDVAEIARKVFGS